VILLAGCASAPADTSPSATRTILQRTDAAAGQEVVLGRLDAPYGAPVSRHIHYGVEMGVVISGVVEMTVDGETPRVLKAGDSFIIPRETVHAARIIEGPLQVLSTWTIDKGKPLSEPR
jgi:quercetin dioxygenase-like cupin family protein